MIAILAKPIEPQPFVPYIPNSTASLDSRRITYSLDAFESTSVPTLLIGCSHGHSSNQSKVTHTHRTIANIISPSGDGLECSFEALLGWFLFVQPPGNLEIIVVGHADCAVIKHAHKIASCGRPYCGTHPPPHPLLRVLQPVILDAQNNPSLLPENLASKNVDRQVRAIEESFTPQQDDVTTDRITIRGQLVTASGSIATVRAPIVIPRPVIKCGFDEA